MKQSIKVLLGIILAILILPSCKKSYLDLQPPSQIPTVEAIIDESSMQTAVTGVYESLRAVDFFGRSIPIDGDLIADNIYIDPVTNSNRYLNEYTYSYIETDGDVQNLWTEVYNTILRTNNVINADIPSSATVDQLKGEALTVRALCYFELVKFFAKPYTVDPSSPGVPIVVKYDAFAKPARNTVAEVYTQIGSDLNIAFGLMTDDSKNSTYISKYVAESILARFYQYKADWTNAQAAALDVVNNGGYTLTDSSSLVTYWSNPFPVSNKVETIFEVEFDNIGNNFTDNLDAFYSQDPSAYGDALVTNNLYNLYSPTDARINLIEQTSRSGRPVLAANKYPNTANPNGKDNTKIIRYAEVLLILAEAYHQNGDDGTAVSILNQLAQRRDPQFAGYSSTGDALLDDIYTERRKELAFEGQRYWDLVRLHRDVVRDGDPDNYASYVPLTLAADDDRRIFPIPKAELNANKNVSQNHGY